MSGRMRRRSSPSSGSRTTRLWMMNDVATRSSRSRQPTRSPPGDDDEQSPGNNDDDDDEPVKSAKWLARLGAVPTECAAAAARHRGPATGGWQLTAQSTNSSWWQWRSWDPLADQHVLHRLPRSARPGLSACGLQRPLQAQHTRRQCARLQRGAVRRLHLHEGAEGGGSAGRLNAAVQPSNRKARQLVGVLHRGGQ